MNIVIGNLVSLLAAVFTAMASWTRDTQKTYVYQTLQCSLLALANVFFTSWSGIAVLLLCAVRNILTAKGKLTLPVSLFFVGLLVLVGFFVNNLGAIGWIVTAATILYTIGALIFHSERMIKINIFVNLLLWIIYDFLIHDFSSLSMDSVILIITLVAIIRTFAKKTNCRQNG